MERPIISNVYATASTTDNMSRNELLAWVNDCLQSEFTKIEQLHTGAAIAQFTDFLFPASLQLKRVKWNSRSALDRRANWKLVTIARNELGINKVVPVDKLIKGKFQDNFEFLQWFKKFFDANYDGHEYNPVMARNFEPLPAGATSASSASRMAPKSTPVSNRMPNQRAGSNVSVNSNASANASRPAAARSSATSVRNAMVRPSKPVVSQPPQPAAAHHPTTNGISKQEYEDLKTRFEDVNRQLNESDEVISGIEKERDFYFTKLRKIEILCQDHEQEQSININKIFDILYETEEGFAPPEDDENAQEL